MRAIAGRWRFIRRERNSPLSQTFRVSNASPVVSVSAVNCVPNGSQIFSQFRFHLSSCLKHHWV
jgi:hypothetical protein